MLDWSASAGILEPASLAANAGGDAGTPVPDGRWAGAEVTGDVGRALSLLSWEDGDRPM